MLFVNTEAPFYLHMTPLLFAVGCERTLLRTVELSAVYRKLAAADRANGGLLSVAAESRFQYGIVGQYRIPEIAA